MDVVKFFCKDAIITEEVVISNRFKGDDGLDIPFVIRAITEQENEDIRLKSYKMNMQNEREFCEQTYILNLVSHAVLSPDLDNAELQRSYSVIGRERLLSKMLLVGEFSHLSDEVMRVCGFLDEKSVDDIKK